MELWTAFVLGLAGSLHCAGMCGPLVLAMRLGPGGGAQVMGRLAHATGRIATYCAVGVAFGLVGKTMVLAGIQRWVSLTLGLALLAGWFGSRRMAFSLPVERVVAFARHRLAGLLCGRSLSASFLLGMINGLLPCGLVYAAGTAAAATGGVVSGAGYMAVFGLGTLPMLLGIGLFGRLVPLGLRLRFAHAIPASVLVLATLLILRGLSLGIPYVSPVLSAGSGACCR
jgi:hypothetical protein